MKIKGKTIKGQNIEVIPILRSDGDFFLKVKAIPNMKDFEDMCPRPVAPKRLVGNQEISNLKDPNYLKAIDKYAERRLNWMILVSLEATEDLEWETIDPSDPSTWDNIRNELKTSGFSDIEINRIVAHVLSVNSLDEDKLEAARERFLLAQAEQQEG